MSINIKKVESNSICNLLTWTTKYERTYYQLTKEYNEMFMLHFQASCKYYWVMRNPIHFCKVCSMLIFLGDMRSVLYTLKNFMWKQFFEINLEFTLLYILFAKMKLPIHDEDQFMRSRQIFKFSHRMISDLFCWHLFKNFIMESCYMFQKLLSHTYISGGYVVVVYCISISSSSSKVFVYTYEF